MSDEPPIAVEEKLCRACGWTAPEYREGDEPVCPECGGEYGDTLERVRNKYRCGEWNTKSRKCENTVDGPDETCQYH